MNDLVKMSDEEIEKLSEKMAGKLAKKIEKTGLPEPSKIAVLLDKSGLKSLVPTVLYITPKKLRIKPHAGYTEILADCVEEVGKYLTSIDVGTIALFEPNVGIGFDKEFLAPDANVYIKSVGIMPGAMKKPGNYAFQFSIYAKNPDHVKGIANAAASIHGGKSFRAFKWKNIKSAFKVDMDPALNTWKTVLGVS